MRVDIQPYYHCGASRLNSVRMGIRYWWKHALGKLINKQPHRDLSDPEIEGKRIAIDLSILLNQLLRSDIDKLSSTCKPIHAAPDLKQNIMTVHQTLSKHIVPVYVFDGIAPDVKYDTRAKRKATLQSAGGDWLNLLDRAIKEPDTEILEQEVSAATIARMKMKKPTNLDHANILQWIKEEGIECYGALYEADQQMVKLEQDGVVDGIYSEDGDIIALGGMFVLAKMSRKSNGEYQFKLFIRDEFMSSGNPYNSKLCKYPGLITHAALLLGNDYHHIDGNGEVTVLGSKEDSYDTTGARKYDGMLDNLAAADEDELSWIKKYGCKGTKSLSDEVFAQYQCAYEWQRHCPVLEKSKSTGEVKIVPLHEFPDPDTDVMAFFSAELDHIHEDGLLDNIYKCYVLPLERKPLSAYTEELNRTYPFQDLDFGTHPVRIQPKLCLVNYLRARAFDARLSDERSQIEAEVQRCIDIDKQVSPSPLKPILGPYDCYEKIKMRVAGNSCDNWNHDYYRIACDLESITDDVIDRHLGAERSGRPSIRRRVQKLIDSGNYHCKSIKCRNVECKSEGTPCIMIYCECLSSKTNTLHTIYAVFDAGPAGRFRRDLSSCSCKKGEHFCSHCIGFLYLLAIIQSPEVDSADTLQLAYRVNPSLLVGEPMLIENAVSSDLYNRSSSQRKRYRKRKAVSLDWV